MASCGEAYAGVEQVVTDLRLVIEVLAPGTTGYDKRKEFILNRRLPRCTTTP